MRASRRMMNPIFVEEERYQWKPQRSLLMDVLSFTGLATGFVLLVLLVVS
ncbi:MAG: hypothetical protein ACQETO_07900 [Pseudomonadota bacterium]